MCNVANKGVETHPNNAAFRVPTMIIRIAAAALVAASLAAAPGIAAHAKARPPVMTAKVVMIGGR